MNIIEKERNEREQIIEALKSRNERLATMTDEEKAALDNLIKEDEAKYAWMMEE